MVREVLTIGTGQAGTTIGKAYWELMLAEHQLDDNGKRMHLDNRNLQMDGTLPFCFRETLDGRFLPRNIFIDTEPMVIQDCILEGNLKNVFVEEHCVFGKEDTANCFAQGRFGHWKTLQGAIIGAFRRTIEECEACDAITLVNSLSGGTGSGVLTSFLECLKEMVPKITKQQQLVIMSKNVGSSVVEPFNTILALSAQTGLSDLKLFYDNETLYNLVHVPHRILNVTTTYTDINHLLSQAMTSITASRRCEGELDLEINSLQTNLVPFPHLNAAVAAVVPFNTNRSKINTSTYGITAEIFLNSHEMCRIDTTHASEGDYLATCILYKGEVSCKEALDSVKEIKRTFQTRFVDWIPTGIKIGMTKQKMIYSRNISNFKVPKRSVSKFSNHTGVGVLYSEMLKTYNRLISQRAFVFPYVREGMEEGEFVDASEKLEDIVKKYESAVGGQENENDNEEEQ